MQSSSSSSAAAAKKPKKAAQRSPGTKLRRREKKATMQAAAAAAAAPLQEEVMEVDELLYVRTFDTFSVPVKPVDVRLNRLNEAAVKYIARCVEGKCGRSGYVRPGSTQLVSISAGQTGSNGFLQFEVKVQYDCCRPLSNSLLRAPLCVCTSNNIAAISGEIFDAHHNLVATVFLSREGVISDAETNDLAFASQLASPHEMANVQAGDTFGCLVRVCEFEITDTQLTIKGQLLSKRAEQFLPPAAAAAAVDVEYEDEEVEEAAIRYSKEFIAIKAASRLDLQALRDELVKEKATFVAGGGGGSSSSSSRSASVHCSNVETEGVFSLPNDRTAYITIALQETSLMATSITSRVRGVATRNLSFLQAWDAEPNLRAHLTNELALINAGRPSNIKDKKGNTPLDTIVELRYQLQKNYRYKLATTFMPAYAKAVFEHFGAKQILDPCGGWGDRLAGALALREASSGALAQKYVSFDPNRAVRGGYRRIAQLFDAAVKTDDGTSVVFANGYETHAMPFEVGAPTLLEDASFDLVFTSPPFFDYEVYSADNPVYNDWIGRFYKPLMLESERCVKAGGHVCIHIDNTSAGDIDKFLCQEVPLICPHLKLRSRLLLVGIMSNEPRSVWVYDRVM